jgi:hypothetical protein
MRLALVNVDPRAWTGLGRRVVRLKKVAIIPVLNDRGRVCGVRGPVIGLVYRDTPSWPQRPRLAAV